MNSLNDTKEDIGTYFDAKRPVCREERQFALFLYNRLLSLKGKKTLSENDLFLLKKCGIEKAHEVIQVAYEACYMRDFFERERLDRYKLKTDLGRRKKAGYPKYNSKFVFAKAESDDENCFNKKLADFIEKNCAGVVMPKNLPLCPNLNYGDLNNYTKNSPGEEVRNLIVNSKNDLFGQEGKRSFFVVASAMMKAKPDLAICYRVGSEYHLKFLECKYLSEIGRDGGLSQIDMQNLICRFLCEKILKADADGNILVADTTREIRFYSELNLTDESCLSKEGNFLIEKLMNGKDYCVE